MSKPPLMPADLKILDSFLDAWCEENGVDRSDEAAMDTAMSLIDWYQHDDKSRTRMLPSQSPEPPLSASMESLLRQIT